MHEPIHFGRPLTHAAISLVDTTTIPLRALEQGTSPPTTLSGVLVSLACFVTRRTPGPQTATHAFVAMVALRELLFFGCPDSCRMIHHETLKRDSSGKKPPFRSIITPGSGFAAASLLGVSIADVFPLVAFD